MWRPTLFLLLYLPMCRTWNGGGSYQDDVDEEYSDSYYHYDGDVVTMPALTTTTLHQKYTNVDINKLLLSMDLKWPGFRNWPINSTPEARSSSSDAELKSSFDVYTKSGMTGNLPTATQPTGHLRNQNHWSTMNNTIADADTRSKLLSQYHDYTRKRREPDSWSEMDEQINFDIYNLGREGNQTIDAEQYSTPFAPGYHTYWASNKPHTYPRSIFVNGTWHMLPPDWPFQSTANYTCVLTSTTTKTTTKANTTAESTTPLQQQVDPKGLLDIIANLTYDYDMNLTERFNETLMKYSVPTCPTLAANVTPLPTTLEPDYANATIVGKCFVCGLDKEEIPQDAYCADAFAGDFLPLVPIDPRARGQIARYRKYCRYLDVRHYEVNEDDPRTVYGRFTGGCSVRWTDLSGVYTQRTCRNKRRPVMGKHFASKRMAKLEMALSHLDNGCIISPMATLLPLSRGVSLYARFHACVCTGAWCNTAATHHHHHHHHHAANLHLLITLWAFILR